MTNSTEATTTTAQDVPCVGCGWTEQPCACDALEAALEMRGMRF